MASREIMRWVTINGVHVPIYEGESKQDVVNRFVAERNEMTKHEQIMKNKDYKEQIDKSLAVTRSGHEKVAQELYGKSFADLTSNEKRAVIAKYNDSSNEVSQGYQRLLLTKELRKALQGNYEKIAKENFGKSFDMLSPNDKRRVVESYNDYSLAEKNAKGMGLNYKDTASKLVSDFNRKESEFIKLAPNQVDKSKELLKWLTANYHGYARAQNYMNQKK